MNRNELMTPFELWFSMFRICSFPEALRISEENNLGKNVDLLHEKGGVFWIIK